MKLIVYGLLAIIVIVIAAVMIGRWRWDRTTQETINTFSRRPPAISAPGAMESLPDPIAGYLRSVFVDEPPTAGHLHFTQEGEFRMSADENSWRPFRASQHVDLTAPGFVWDARIEMMPFVSVRVRDAYVGGRGTMLGKVLSVVTVVDERDKDALSSGALLRYLAEAAWFPTALMPSASLRWRAIDDLSAEATLSDSGIDVAATFHFDKAGDIVGVSAKRYREVDGEYVLTPWRGRFWDHAVRENTRIPLEGEVAWVLPEGELVYWRGKIVDYELN